MEGTTLCNGAGKVVEAVGKLTNIEEEKEKNRQFRRQPDMIGMTGLFNKNLFSKSGGTQFAECRPGIQMALYY